MKYVSLFSVFIFTLSVFAQVKTEKGNTYIKLRCGLYLDPTGDLFFGYERNAPDLGSSRDYISWVYGGDANDTLNGGLTELKYVVDTGSFEILNQYYCADKNHVFIFSSLSSGGMLTLDRVIDSKTLLVLGTSPYCLDKQRVYYLGKVVEGADKRTFKPLENTEVTDLACDKDHLYRMGERMTSEEIATFQLTKCQD